jgi:hypothetical protein
MAGVDDDDPQSLDPRSECVIDVRSRPRRQARMPSRHKQLIDIRSQRPIDDAALLRSDARQQLPMSPGQIPPRKIAKPHRALQPSPLKRPTVRRVVLASHEAAQPIRARRSHSPRPTRGPARGPTTRHILRRELFPTNPIVDDGPPAGLHCNRACGNHRATPTIRLIHRALRGSPGFARTFRHSGTGRLAQLVIPETERPERPTLRLRFRGGSDRAGQRSQRAARRAGRAASGG